VPVVLVPVPSLLFLLTAVLALVLALPPVALAATDATWCHRVRSGDTLFALARRYHTTVDRLRALNGLRRDDVLRAGAVLALPDLHRLRDGAVVLDAQPLTARPGNLFRENAAANRARLSRLRDERMLRRFVGAGLLVPLPADTATYWIDGVRPDFQVARPWTRRFVVQLAAGFHGLFGSRLKVTGLTRTTDFQRRLRLVNSNAAPAEGDTASSHLTGAAVDIGTRDLSARELAWLRHVLRRLAAEEVLLAIEEFQHPHFHVMVLPAYKAYARTVGKPILLGGC
jgi:LysM repeat protein